jgi:hypothetical protein
LDVAEIGFLVQNHGYPETHVDNLLMYIGAILTIVAWSIAVGYSGNIKALFGLCQGKENTIVT